MACIDESEIILIELYSFGQNSYGELGHGDTIERHVPTRVEFATNKRIEQLVAGNEHTVLLCGNGEVFCCGYNDSGQCAIGTTGRQTNFQLVEALRNMQIKQIYTANGSEHTIFVTMEGEAYVAGYNSRGQLGLGNTVPSATPRLVTALTGKVVSLVSCSYYHSLFATDDNQLYSCGRNDHGQLGLGDLLDRHSPRTIEAFDGKQIVSIGCGQYHTVVATKEGEVYSFGKNDYGQLGFESNESKSIPTLVENTLLEINVTLIACGYYHTLCLTEDGLVYSFGRNDYGQLGLGDKNPHLLPQLVSLLEDKYITWVAAGCYHSLALTDNGCVYSFGRNNHGQLGLDNTNDHPIPQEISLLKGKKVAQIKAGFYHSLCLTGNTVERLMMPTKSLVVDLSKLINNSSRSDVAFIVEEKPLYAHRCIIMARCEMLERMLDGPMRESKENEIIIPEQSYQVFLALMEFIYTDAVEQLNPENSDVNFALDLLALADQYLVGPLKLLCENTIQKSIRLDNVAFMLQTADQRQAHVLKKKCFEYIMRNFGKVIGTTHFHNLPQQLLSEVLMAASKRGVTIRY